MKAFGWWLAVAAVIALVILATSQRSSAPSADRRPLDIDDGARISAADVYSTNGNQRDRSRPTSLDMWRIYTSTNEMDDSPIVRLSAAPVSQPRDRYGHPRSVRLFVRCSQNTTSLILGVDDYTGIDDIQVQIRLDRQSAFVRLFGVSTDRENIGLWSGAQSIPIIRQMATAREIRFEYTLPGESPEVVTFDLSGFDAVVPRVASTCHWEL